MDLMRAVDAYCERVGAGVWDEPWNAVTNLAFILAAVVMWRQSRGETLARALCIALALIGVSSGLWHVFAVVWTGAADTLSILIYILIYLYGANLRFLGLSPLWAGAGVLAFFPYAIVVGWAASQVAWLGSSAGYVPVAVLIALYAIGLWRRAPATARGLAIGVVILCLSLTARTVDDAICAAFPLGTHFLWHLLNALMLGWMIHVYLRHKPPRVD
jgi:hypothetical protein